MNIRKEAASLLIGMISGIALSVIIYPEPKAETIIKEVPVYVETIKEVPVYIAIKESEEEIMLKRLGEFELTAYCACKKCCGKSNGITASGTKAKENRTIAVDPKVIPFGTKVVIDGQEYIAEDCGGSVKGNVIDIFFENHEDAQAFGRRTADVFVYLEEGEING